MRCPLGLDPFDGGDGLEPWADLFLFSSTFFLFSTFSDVLAVSQSYVFYNGTIKGSLSPDKYNDAYVYVISYAPGVVLPQNLATLIALDVFLFRD
ncbi:hypothetical protein [Thermofilum sp.]|uniref:hypothetical protein n=1 Tax=Thermofilum sp. TaxID=1961369 RepID=UPI003164BE55